MSAQTATAMISSFRMDGARTILEAWTGATQIRNQVEAIEEAVERRPAFAFDFAKTLIETVAKTVLNDLGVPFDSNWDCPKLFKETLKQLNLVPDDHATAGPATDSLKRIIGGLVNAISGLCELRNHEGSTGHGRDAFAGDLETVQAELAARSADAAVSFIWSAHRRYMKDGKAQRIRYDDMAEYNDWIDTVAHESPVTIFSITYRQSELLYKADPDSYRDGLADYDAYLEELKKEETE